MIQHDPAMFLECNTAHVMRAGLVYNTCIPGGHTLHVATHGNGLNPVNKVKIICFKITMGRKKDELRKRKRAASTMSQDVGQMFKKMNKLATGKMQNVKENS